MKTTMLRVLLGFVATRQSLAAVTWRGVGCDGYAFKNVAINDIWDNAVTMTEQSQARLDFIPTESSLTGFPELERRAGANAKFMFGVDFGPIQGLNEAGRAATLTARNMYSDIRSLLKNTRPDFNVQNAFLFCGAQSVVKSTVPGYSDPSPIWHGEIQTTADDGTVSTEYIMLSYVGPKSDQPCTEKTAEGDADYVGKTFTANKLNPDGSLSGDTFYAIIVCPEQWEADGYDIYPTLGVNYQATKAGNNKYPYVGNYNSVSGTLVHEMVHVVGRVRDNKKYEDEGRVGFRVTTALAKVDQATALVNPDTYRIFAEMSMSPATKWGMPNA